MKTKIACLLAVVVWLAIGAVSEAQQTTERYVPIGMSPGISGKYSAIGRISAVDREAATLTVEGEAGNTRTFKVNESTRIWLDRSNWQLANLDGSYRDCVVGQRVEVMYLRDSESTAAWIKVEAETPR